jgi:L-alanine-DL-glutamate epimerase-like enolase superfamily enzyme
MKWWLVKIVDVECIHLRLGKVTGKADSAEDALLIKISTDEGITGYGEVCSASNVVREIIEAPIYETEFCRGLRDVLINQDPFDVEVLWDKMYCASLYHGRRGPAIHAISGIDIALWDVIGKAVGKPVHKLLGGCYRDKVRAYASTIMPSELSKAKKVAAELKSAGYTAIKFGYHLIDPVFIEAVKQVVGDDILVMIDVGPRLDIDSAIRYARECEKQGVYWLEEPLMPDNLEGYAQLADSVTHLKIATGENESTRWAFRDLLDRGRPHIIQPDLTRAGGFSECKRIAAMARDKDVLCIPHGWGTGVLVAASLQFVASTPNSIFLEFCSGTSPFIKDLVSRPSLKLEDGYVRVPTGPGLGLEIDEKVIRKYRT